MKKRKLILFLAILISICSCIEKEGYYTKEEQDFIDLLCNNTWVKEKKNTDGSLLLTYYDFNIDATYTKVYKSIDVEGRENVISYKYNWAFGDEYFNSIYFSDTSEYWMIEKLNVNMLCVYNIHGNIGTSNYRKEYWEFVPCDE